MVRATGCAGRPLFKAKTNDNILCLFAQREILLYSRWDSGGAADGGAFRPAEVALVF